MKMLKKELFLICSGLAVVSSLLLVNPLLSNAATESPSLAEDMSQDAVENNAMDESSDVWEYVFEDRPDPFLPFIQPQVATTNIPDEEEVVLTGMQLFEPGQLKLVAIMSSTKGEIAMVEDVTGKGYIINEGMPIGRYGVVSQIKMDQVNITETRRVAGKDVVTPVVMRLNKEGDK